MTRLRILCLLLFIVSDSRSHGGERSDSAAESRRIGWPLIEGIVNGTAVPIMVADTGSQACIVDQTWAHQNLKGFEVSRRRLISLAGASEVDVFGRVPFSLKNGPEKPMDIFTGNLSPVSHATDCSFAIAGMPYLRNHIAKFSASRGCELLTELPAMAPETFVVPLRNGQTRPEIQIDFPTIGNRWILIDTGGMGSLALSKDRIGMLNRTGHILKSSSGRGFDTEGRSFVSQYYLVRRFGIGDIQFLNVDVRESQVETIGMGVLRHFDMILDFSNDRAFLTFIGNNRVYSSYHRASGTGGYVSKNGRIRILDVWEMTPASEIGLKTTDEITMIDGLNPASLGYWQLQEILSQAGKTIPLTVLRDGKEMSMKMTLRHSVPFPPDWPPEKPEFNPEP